MLVDVVLDSAHKHDNSCQPECGRIFRIFGMWLSKSLTADIRVRRRPPCKTVFDGT